MRLYPGDVAIINNIVFENKRKDHAAGGRPCIVLYTEKTDNEELVYFLPTTTKQERLFLCNSELKYHLTEIGSKMSLVELFEINCISKSNVIKVITNVGDELFDIIDKTIYYHENFNNENSVKNRPVLKFINDNQHLFSNPINRRKEQLNEKNNVEIKYCDISNNQGKMYVKKYKNRYKYQKEQVKNIAIYEEC